LSRPEGLPTQDQVPQVFTIAAWNAERCLFPEKSAALLQAQQPDVVLLSEVDCGMARTAQRHPTAEIAEALGMSYAYGVEFFELGLGGETEQPYCLDDHNKAGWHGNAVLSRAKPSAVALIRLDDHGHWFVESNFKPDPTQPRIGGRMAIAAVLPTVAGESVRGLGASRKQCRLSPSRQADGRPDGCGRDFAPETPVDHRRRSEHRQQRRATQVGRRGVVRLGAGRTAIPGTTTPMA
jgi:hypothetical protein